MLKNNINTANQKNNKLIKINKMKILQKIKNETFTIEKALNRMQWRFFNENVKVNETKIVINELDQKAISLIIETTENLLTKNINENILFAKIYCHALNIELLHFRNIKLALQSLEHKLKLPIEFHYDRIADELNRIILTDYENEKQITNKHPYIRTDNEDNEMIDRIKESKEYQIKILGFWKKEDVYKSLNKTINDIINRIKN